MSDLNKLIIVEVCDVLVKGDISVVELIEVCIVVIDVLGVLNVFVYNMLDMVWQMVVVVDGWLKVGDVVLMIGILVGVKDLFCVCGVLL